MLRTVACETAGYLLAFAATIMGPEKNMRPVMSSSRQPSHLRIALVALTIACGVWATTSAAPAQEGSAEEGAGLVAFRVFVLSPFRDLSARAPFSFQKRSFANLRLVASRATFLPDS